MLLGRSVRDRDFLVLEAAPEEFKARHPRAKLVGKSFPVFLLDRSEYAWPRGGGLEEDLRLRDLTINALALGASPEVAGLLTFHPKALLDLQHGVLRPASETSLADDPIRVFRAARFAAELPDFSPHPDLSAAMRGAAGLLRDQFAERVCAETRKALAAPKPSRFLDLLLRTGCLSPWFAEFDGADDVPAGPPRYHDKSVIGHTMDVMDRLAQYRDPLLVWMGLCHDLGKTQTPEEEWPSHHGHDKAGVPLAAALGRRLGLPNRYVKAGEFSAALHMKAGRYDELRPGSRVDLLTQLHKHGLTEELFHVVAADHGRDYLEKMRRDLAVLLAVRLPRSERGLGAASGGKLRLLRCEALSKEYAR